MSPALRKPSVQVSERRLSRRYAIRFALQYRLLRNGISVKTGHGQTVNLSSGGALVEFENPLPPGVEVELLVVWPPRTDGAGLTLYASGATIRLNGNRTAVSFARYELRTSQLQLLT